MIMDAKLEAQLKENPPLNLRFECKICKIEFTRTICYEDDKQEYIKFREMEKAIKKVAEDDEELDDLVFIDICSECRNK